MRCDVNISVKNNRVEGKKVEIKNVAGARFVEKAIEYEIIRQAKMIKEGEPILEETRRYDAASNTTKLMRSKDQVWDYRFLTDPDLPVFSITDDRIKMIKRRMEHTPFERKK